MQRVHSIFKDVLFKLKIIYLHIFRYDLVLINDAQSSEYDLRRLSPQLLPLAFLIGKWRSEHGGKAIFPTIPKFTYGEEVDISIPDDELQAQRALNYTYAFSELFKNYCLIF